MKKTILGNAPTMIRVYNCLWRNLNRPVFNEELFKSIYDVKALETLSDSAKRRNLRSHIGHIRYRLNAANSNIIICALICDNREGIGYMLVWNDEADKIGPLSLPLDNEIGKKRVRNSISTGR